MSTSETKPLMGRVAYRLSLALQHQHMRRLGIANTMAVARAYGRMAYGRNQRRRERAYAESFADLLQENGPPQTSRLRLEDGWVLDTSGSLPHLGELVDAAEKVIEERGGSLKPVPDSYRSFFQEIQRPADAANRPPFLDFVLSSDVLSVVADYLGCIPVMSTTLPHGIRLAESRADYDEYVQGRHRDSQLFHVDYYSRPNVYVIVLLRDVTAESGPFSFMGAEVSRKVSEALGYWSRGMPYRLSDEQVYSVVPRSELHELIYPRGTVLFIDPSRCLHFGSRDAVVPRYMMMYGLTTACRTDLSELFVDQERFPVRASDSRLRKMVLDKSYVLE